MKKLTLLVSLLFLGCTIFPSILLFKGIITEEINKILMLLGTVGWFITAPFWMNKKTELSQENK
jgi:hypothetical protein